MAKSLIILAVIVVVILSASAASYYYTVTTVEEVSKMLEEAGTDQSALGEVSRVWEEKKQPLMFIINHRDIESISVALLRAHREAANGRHDMAKEEAEVAAFLMDELSEREKLSTANIF